jgi:PAS domain S-box-containing protein
VAEGSQGEWDSAEGGACDTAAQSVARSHGPDDGLDAGLLRELLEAAPEALLVIDDHDRVALASARAAALLGQARDQLVGRTVASVLPGLRRSGAGAVTGQRGDGGEVKLEVEASTLQTARGPFSVVSLRPREASPPAATERRVRSEFVASMSHVLRTPLNSIIGFAKLMHHGKVGPVSDRHREYLGDILNSANHLLSLINDVLDLAKADAGLLEFRPEPIDLPQLIGEVRDAVAALAALKQVRIEVDVDPGCVGLELDRGKFKQMVYNLLSNALKFTERGRIDVRVTTEGAASWRLEIEDTGLGIAPEQLAQLFAEGDGKRIGLVLTRRIVEAQGGRLGVRSTVGQGSTFFAVLPRAPARPAAVRDAQVRS